MVAKQVVTIDVLDLCHWEGSSIEQGYLIHEPRHGITSLSQFVLLGSLVGRRCQWVLEPMAIELLSTVEMVARLFG